MKLADEKPKCACGHDEKHPLVSPRLEYSLWGWCLVLCGISYKPRRITYRCDRCGSAIRTDENPAGLVF